MKKILILPLAAFTCFVLFSSCGPMSLTAIKKQVIKDSLQGFVNRLSGSQPTDPSIIVNSVVIKKAKDNMDSQTFGHPESFSYITWDAELTITKDFKMVELNSLYFQPNAFSLGYFGDSDGEFFKQLKMHRLKTGDTIKITGMNTLLIGNESGGHWVCYFLFDDGHPNAN